MLRIFTISTFMLVSYLLACRCPILPSREAFCRADWVSHVKVLQKEQLSADKLKDVRYTILQKKVYKTPNSCSIIVHVLTSSESSACGLDLEVGSEYLLSGSYYDREFHTSSCFQVVSDDPADNFSGNLMEWKYVSPAFREQLKSFTC